MYSPAQVAPRANPPVVCILRVEVKWATLATCSGNRLSLIHYLVTPKSGVAFGPH
jgi:hypothetical protein